MSSLNEFKVSEGEVCAVTGANGFLGFHIVSQLLEKNVKTLAIVRSEKSSNRLEAVFSEQVKSGLLKFAYVPDITQLNDAYTEAFKGVSHVIHTASPIFQLGQVSTNPSKDFYDPAINGALNALTSAAKHQNIKSLVITGSVVARYTSLTQSSGELLRDFLLPVTREEAEKLNHVGLMYRASKSLSERAIRKWVEENKPHFSTTILIPSLLLGPHADPLENKFTGSNSVYRTWFEDPKQNLDNNASTTSADVRDTAKAHINAVFGNIQNPYFIGSSLQSYFIVQTILHAFEALKYVATIQDVNWGEEILTKLSQANKDKGELAVPWRDEDAKSLSIYPMHSAVETFAKYIGQPE